MNILVIKPGAIGDLLQLTPVVRELKQLYPESLISIMVSSAPTASLFRYNPYIHETIIFDKRGRHRSFRAMAQLWVQLRKRRFDLVVNFQRSNLKAWFLASSSFPCRVLVYHNAGHRVVHAVVNHLETLAPLGITPSLLDLDLFTGPEDEDYAEKLFSSENLVGRPVVALNPGASNRIKCWSPARFAGLGNRLVEELGAAVVLVGGTEDRDLAEEIISGMRHEPVDLVGRISLLQLGAVLRRCNLLVSGDTGPLHLATAVRTPVLALFGAIDPRRTGPVGKGHRVIRHDELQCVPCVAKKCSNTVQLECMEKISVDEVLASVVDMLRPAAGDKTEGGS
jgi:lipopolysaccharide heptosyltransferase II